mmetsp:Transcript_20939/g.23298  ORF Transcript_20939/g.23298 Transcript_20939/m.23298 type:complete len:181 (+) Transcript_20939:14-556(+)
MGCTFGIDSNGGGEFPGGTPEQVFDWLIDLNHWILKIDDNHTRIEQKAAGSDVGGGRLGIGAKYRLFFLKWVESRVKRGNTVHITRQQVEHPVDIVIVGFERGKKFSFTSDNGNNLATTEFSLASSGSGTRMTIDRHDNLWLCCLFVCCLSCTKNAIQKYTREKYAEIIADAWSMRESAS